MNEELQLKLQSWVDGELSGAEVRRMEELTARDPAARALAEELRSLKLALADNEPLLAVPETREFYWSKIEKQIRREAAVAAPVAKTPWFSRQLRYFAPILGAAVAACALLLTTTRHAGPPAPDTLVSPDFTTTTDAMDATTYHDEVNGLTVVWLTDKTPAPSDLPDNSPSTD